MRRRLHGPIRECAHPHSRTRNIGRRRKTSEPHKNRSIRRTSERAVDLFALFSTNAPVCRCVCARLGFNTCAADITCGPELARSQAAQASRLQGGGFIVYLPSDAATAAPPASTTTTTTKKGDQRSERVTELASAPPVPPDGCVCVCVCLLTCTQTQTSFT